MLVIDDALDAIYLGSFVFGLLFSALSLVLGALQIGGFAHLHGHGPFHLGHHGAHQGGASAPSHRDVVGPLNLSSLVAALAWFGGIGYLVRNALGAAPVISFIVGIAAALAAGAAISWFLVHVILPQDRALDPEDYRLPGTIARVTSSIRAGGTGEVVYEQAGVRQVAAARAADGRPLPRGTEVVILGCEHGIARVEPWDDFLAGDLDAPGRADPARTPTHPTSDRVA